MAKQKYEREIAEILERLDRQGRGTVQPRDEPAEPPRLARFASSLGAPATWTNRAWLGLSVGLPLLGVLVYRMEPLLGSVLVLAGIFLFLSPLALALVGLARAEKRPKWRGRVVEMPDRSGSLAASWRLRVWAWRQRWERWRNRRR
jgi:hypothetical protein